MNWRWVYSFTELVLFKTNLPFIFQRDIQNSSKTKSEVDNLIQIVKAKQYELEEFRKHKAQLVNELEEQKIAIQKSRDLAMNQYNKRRELETKLNDEKTPEVAALLHKIERLQNIKTQKIDVR